MHPLPDQHAQCQLFIYSVFVLLILTIPFIVTNEHLVYSGACALYDAQFCSRQVENSVCNKVKNECFCKKDFVAIRENGRVTCKTLLTDLKCRVDRDCIHVNRSSCHPGAGYCSCPGNTIYVPQQHACRTRISYNQDATCKACQMQNGSCFLHENWELSELEQRYNPGRVGCVCPNNGIPIKMHSEDWQKYICSGKLVDIGSECNQKQAVCRSKNAVCEPVITQPLRSINPHHVPANFLWPNIVERSSDSDTGTNEPTKICKCHKTMVPVYQSTLGYTECFPKLGANAAQCRLCVSSGGTCYDLNDDGVGDGCVCPPHKSLSSKVRTSGDQACTVLHVAVNCTDGYFSVCYRPHTLRPYEQLSLDLAEGKAVAQLIPTLNANTVLFSDRYTTPESRKATDWLPGSQVPSASRDLCQLSKVGSDVAIITDRMSTTDAGHVTNVNRDVNEQLCFHHDVWQMKQFCGVRLYKLSESTIQYEAILEVMVNRSRRSPNKDLQIPLKCIAHRPKRPPAQEDVHVTLNARKLNDPPIDLEFRVVNSQNKEIYSTQLATKIRLDALLFDRSGQFKVVTVEKCQYSNRTANAISYASQKPMPFIYQGCPLANSRLQIQFTNGQYPSDHVQSALFPAFREGNLSTVFFHCLFRLCSDPQYCIQPACDSIQANERFEVESRTRVSKPGTSPSTHTLTTSRVNQSASSTFWLIERWTHIEVTAENGNFFSVANAQSSSSTIQEYSMDSAVRHLNFPSLSSPPAASKAQPCHFALCLNTTHLAWLSIGILTLLMLFTLLLLFFYKRRHTGEEQTKLPRNQKKRLLSQPNPQISNVSLDQGPKSMSNRTYVSSVPEAERENAQTQPFVRIPTCLLGTAPRVQEPFSFEQHHPRESGILSPVFFGSESNCPEESESQLFCFREATNQSATSTAMMSSECPVVNPSLPCKMRLAHSEAYCYCDQLSRSAIDQSLGRTQTLPLERRPSRPQHIVNFTPDQMDKFNQGHKEALASAGWQQSLSNTDPVPCGYSSSTDRKRLLPSYPYQIRRTGHGDYSEDLGTPLVETIQPHSTDLIVLNNCTSSSDQDTKHSSISDSSKTGAQHVHS